jgi:hypothetical protein
MRKIVDDPSIRALWPRYAASMTAAVADSRAPYDDCAGPSHAVATVARADSGSDGWNCPASTSR